MTDIWKPLDDRKINDLRRVVSGFIPPSLPPGEELRFSCNETRDIDGNLISKYCDYDPNGKYTNPLDCMKDCVITGETPTPPTSSKPPYKCPLMFPIKPGRCKCVNGCCINDENGEFASYEECVQVCRATEPPTGTGWSCIPGKLPGESGTCVEVEGGEYDSYDKCMNNCVPYPPPIKCPQPIHTMTIS